MRVVWVDVDRLEFEIVVIGHEMFGSVPSIKGICTCLVVFA